MGSRREHWRAVGWLGIIAILSNVLAGALCHAPAKTASLVDDMLGPLVLCTANGPLTMPHGGPDGPGGEKNHCTACTLLAGLVLAVAFAFVAISFPTRIFYRLTFRVRTLADHLSLGGIRSRAPPLHA